TFARAQQLGWALSINVGAERIVVEKDGKQKDESLIPKAAPNQQVPGSGGPNQRRGFEQNQQIPDRLPNQLERPNGGPNQAPSPRRCSRRCPTASRETGKPTDEPSEPRTQRSGVSGGALRPLTPLEDLLRARPRTSMGLMPWTLR